MSEEATTTGTAATADEVKAPDANDESKEPEKSSLVIEDPVIKPKEGQQNLSLSEAPLT